MKLATSLYNCRPIMKKLIISFIAVFISIFSINKTYSQNTYATATDLGTLSCASSPYNGIASGTTIGSGSECGNTAEDKWYMFTIATTADVTIDLCGSGYDTYLRLYNSGAGSCGAATQINFNDDSGCGLQSTISQPGLTAGTYIIMVEGYSSNSGNYTLNIQVNNCAGPMTYSSSTTTQANTSNVYKGSLNQEVMGVQIVTTGALTPFDVTQFRINMTGTTNTADVTNIDIYCTGTSSTFATTTLFGSVAPGGGALLVNGTQTLSSGTNYFWIVYDISATAIINNVIDAQCTRITMSGGVGNQIPAPTSQAGSRPIADYPGNSPCSAYTLTVGCSGSKVNCDNTGMTDSGISAPSCASYAGGDIWCVTTVPASGEFKVETYEVTLADVGMTVYTESGGCSGTLTEIACDDNSGFGNMSKISLTGLTPGNTLYIRTWDNNNDEIGTYEIDAADLSTNYCVTGNGIDLGGGCAQLTAASNNQLGSIWDADDKFDFSADFTYDFTVYLGNNDGGADGIAFVIQNDPAGLGANGISGNQLGAGGITNSLIVEVDTYINTEDRNDGLPGLTCAAGPDWDHLDIWINGVVNPGNCSSGIRTIPSAAELLDGSGILYNIENGLDHTLRIDYVSATQTLTASILDASASFTYGTVSYSPVDPMTLFGTNFPYFGFTGSTGGLNNLQTACLSPTLILPVSLTRFTASCNNEKVELSWETASETNNDYFEIERSYDGLYWYYIGRIIGAGNSNEQIDYNFIDKDINGDKTVYYRLKQVDYDGQSSYSESITSNCKNQHQLSVYVYPDLNNKKTTIYFSQMTTSEYNLDIINNLGIVVQTCKIPKGSNNFIVPENTNTPMGTYIFTIYNDNERFVEKHLRY